MLDSARELCAEKGFDRTTIRALATATGVDPALVMQYFGSKRELFGRAVQVFPELSETAYPDAVVDRLPTTLGIKLGGLPEGTRSMLRSVLTDPAAAEHVRATLDRRIDGLGAALPTAGDAELRAELRAGLRGTALLGVAIGHQFLRLDALSDAPAGRVSPPCCARRSKPLRGRRTECGGPMRRFMAFAYACRDRPRPPAAAAPVRDVRVVRCQWRTLG
ncbi:TetR/AcrR family transcriptional regulator [Streptomyces sp. NPDC057697]|uniref:TetR/AcrR family transcriptional regulator n=1 Tax=Streptomyces sp. NPDC057697 TaxID=3346219 RepID=UPI0036C4D988